MVVGHDGSRSIGVAQSRGRDLAARIGQSAAWKVPTAVPRREPAAVRRDGGQRNRTPASLSSSMARTGF